MIVVGARIAQFVNSFLLLRDSTTIEITTELKATS